ncbi:TetR/AcrR family transcriptional regulator [Arcicella sp. LKC2W]|uniref:TetR/AcrR family transcriptional regulator n=1 Tax=Arcicella sp. LKC2W TaxID=2984198 RepID=UPI002B21DBDE|nr:TetR/AcrR family transcriptional regulator [Arcicella sp. LKC2W]MEA5459490.1 TetR/AcrR family transcriptional regulator [Arcicella sp. LKC2W]
MEIKERIIAKAREHFFRYGIKSVTMDDIASELGISKKTIYQHFEDKDELVHQLMLLEIATDECEWDELNKISSNVVEKTMKAMDLCKDSFTEINPSAFFDIKKYHPRTWKLFQEHKEKFVLEMIKKDLVEGIGQGYFRADIKVDILARMRLEQVEMGFDPHIFPPNKFTVVDVQITLLDHFMRGMLTEKGLEIYQHYQL